MGVAPKGHQKVSHYGGQSAQKIKTHLKFLWYRALVFIPLDTNRRNSTHPRAKN
jgi:hypothetical protein